MMTRFQIEVEKTISAPLPFTPNRIRTSCFPDSPEPLNEVTTNRIVEKIGLNEAEHIQSRRSGHPV